MHWASVEVVPIMLISGPEKYLAKVTFDAVKTQLLARDPSLQLHEIQADTYAAGELVTLASPSLFGEPRLIYAQNVEKSNDEFLKDMKSYLLAPAYDTTLILRHTGGMRGKAVLDAVRKGAKPVSEPYDTAEINCPEIKPYEKPQLVKSEVARLKGRIEAAALQLLVDAYQEDLEELMNSVRQLIAVTGGNITVAAVENLTGGRVEAGSFRVADAAVAGSTQQAIFLLRQSLSTGTSGIAILAALNLKVRNMAKLMGSRGSVAESAKRFGLVPWQAERALKDLRGWREVDLARAVEMGAATEFLMKGGSRDPIYALEKYVLFVAGRGR